MHNIRKFSAFYSYFLGDFRSNDVTFGSPPVTWGHVTSFPITWLPPASYSLVGGQTNSIRQFSAFYSHFQVTSGQMMSLPSHFQSLEVRDVISYHVADSSRELQPSRKANTLYACFRPSTATSKWLPLKLHHFRITSCHPRSHEVISCHVTASSWSYSLVGSQMHSIHKFSVFYIHFQVTSGQMTSLSGHIRSPEVTRRHFLSRDCLLQPTAL